MNTLRREKKVLILKCLNEGMSLRATARITGASRTTIAKLQRDASMVAAAYTDEVLVDLCPERIQVDEMWAYVYAKEAHLDSIAESAPGWAGSTWTWIGVDPETKLALGWHIGQRTGAEGYKFFKGMSKRLVKGERYYQVSTDGFKVTPPPFTSAWRVSMFTTGRW